MIRAAPEPLALWATDPEGARLYLHGNAVVVDGAGVLVLGPSGAGKSSLSMELMAHGAQLVSDDGVWVEHNDAGLTLHRPDTAPPLIEARGIGLLNTGPIRPKAPLRLVVDLDRPETARLPPRRIATFGNVEVELILGAGQPTLAATLLHLLRYGRATI